MLRQHASRRLLACGVPRCCTRSAPTRLLSSTSSQSRRATPVSSLSPRATALVRTPRLRLCVDAAPFCTSPANLKKEPRGFFDATNSTKEENKSRDAEKQPDDEEQSGGDSAKADAASPAVKTAAEVDLAKETEADAAKLKSPSDSADSAADSKASSSGASSSGSSGGDGAGGGDGGKKGRKPSADKALQKPVVPEIYPQVMAIPIAKRPLFPGFYKAITIKDPNVASAITEMIKRGQPYVGAFLFKDENADDDIIHNADEVHDVGVFAQITSAFPLHGEGATGLTAILYPHRRIRLSTLIPPGAGGNEASTADVVPVPDAASPAAVTAGSDVAVPEPIPVKATDEEAQREKKGDVVASFEESAVATVPKSEAPSTSSSITQASNTALYEPTSFLRKFKVSLVNIENLVEEPFDAKSPVIRAITNEIVNVFKEVAQMNSLFRDQISTFSMSQSAGHVTAEPAKLADFAAAVSAGEPAELQEVLSSLDVEVRLQKALVVLKNELMNAQLQSKITREVESKITKRQREYWLMEQMKGIRRELGIKSDGKDKLVEKFKEKADELAMPEAVRKVFDDEINKLAHLEPAASEFNVTRNYLDWLTQIPWGQRSAENFGIHNAVTVLDEDHYGLKDVKDRILEFIAVGKLRGTVEGKILCFVGPPGVGKTSIGKSIARALNRQYYRFSVGGLTDVAEIKGHRRTYVGALPGRVIQALKKCQTENPLILIDEIDKIGKGYQGDPSSALLELLDPEQNSSFLDHYMDVPVDLSKVLFVCTANMTDTIPRPLLDRMEVIRLSGYVADEKMAIAERYLAPAAKEMAGLQSADVTLSQEAIDELIKSYCRESGVRNLKKQIEKVYRKSALKIVQDMGDELLPTPAAAEKALSKDADGTASVTAAEETAASEVASDDASSTTSTTSTSSESTAATETSGDDSITTNSTTAKTSKPTTTDKPREPLRVPESVHVVIDRENLKDYVGPPVFTSDRLYDRTPPGVTMGLAWTQMGGAAMYVETILQSALRPSTRPSLEITGNIKAVMKESSTIAYSYAKSFMAREFSDNHFFDKAKLHVHVPEGAVQKDGPSAGITMATSLLSLAFDHSIDPTVAMTGELTLTGKVLRIGGLREKTIAARRAGCKTIVFPDDNMSDWLELPENIKEGIDGRPVKYYSDVFSIVFEDLDREEASKCKICEWKKLHEDKNESKKDEKDD
ncbi:ATP-dependent Lon protease pim1 [Sporothrix epigloea]|uniref:Lon protease homolog, mitochondrial n=1 Tax=Sporothrix epigloea TaxID=1892477 RepID=A0ABP0DGF1_9PEZI